MNRIKEYRARSHLTQQQLSEKLGVSISTVYQMEKGQKIPSLRNAFKLANFFNVPIEEIFPDFKRRTTHEKQESRVG